MWQGETVDTDHLSELTEEEYEVGYIRSHQKGFPRIDTKYLIPFFTRRFTKQVSLTVQESTKYQTLKNQYFTVVFMISFCLLSRFVFPLNKLAQLFWYCFNIQLYKINEEICIEICVLNYYEIFSIFKD